jgi:RNA polymerase sigma-70 factor (ECF subfamily)
MNAAISLRRKKKVAVSLDTGSKHDLLIDPADESRDNQPGEAIERREDESRLQAALNRLSPEHRTAIVLKDIEDLRYEEIAEIMNVPVGTVRSRLHRARVELREMLERDER